MARETTLTIRLPDALRQKLDREASATEVEARASDNGSKGLQQAGKLELQAQFVEFKARGWSYP